MRAYALFHWTTRIYTLAAMVTVMYLCWGDLLIERGIHPLTYQKPIFSGVFLVSALVSMIIVGSLGLTIA
jgi:hypothetical protein